MKNSLKYLQLWQKKRSELELNANPQLDWQQMKGILDKQLPVQGPQGGGQAFHAAKLWSAIAFVAGLAALLYFALSPDNRKIEKKIKTEQEKSMPKDSIAKPSLPDNTSLPDQPVSSLHPAVTSVQISVSRPGFSLQAASPLPYASAVAPMVAPELKEDIRQATDSIPRSSPDTANTAISAVQTNTLTRPVPRATIQGKGLQTGDTVINQRKKASGNKTKVRASRIKRSNGGGIFDGEGWVNADWGATLGADLSSGNGALFFGPFAALRMGEHLGLSTQVRFGTSQKISGSYSQPYSGTRLPNLSQIVVSDSRKLHSIQVPLLLEYRAGKLFHFKAGPVVDFLTRQTAGRNLVSPDSLRRDTAYYVNTLAALSRTTYVNKLNYGILAGAGFHYKRFLFDVAYLRRFSELQVVSDLGGYKARHHSFQFSLSFQFNKP
jgi:hypothetical protein